MDVCGCVVNIFNELARRENCGATAVFVLTEELAEKRNFSEDNVSMPNCREYTEGCVRVLCGEECSLDDCDTSGPLFRT